jgi:hypothetical protein
MMVCGCCWGTVAAPRSAPQGAGASDSAPIKDNAQNLSEEMLAELEALPDRQRKWPLPDRGRWRAVDLREHRARPLHAGGCSRRP